MPAPARLAAYHALRAIVDGRSDLPAALAASRHQLADERDRALAADIVSGTERWRRRLDAVIEPVARRPLAAIDPDILCVLRLSVYQLLHLDRVPASAVVNDAVELARHARRASAAGFVNAVLRAVVRGGQPPLPARPAAASDRTAALAYLGVTESHPEWLVARWLDRVGFDAAERWARFNNEIPLLTLRANTLRASRDRVSDLLAAAGVETRPTTYAPDGLVVLSGHPLREPGNGSFFVQDEASQLVSHAVGARPGEHVLDLCASPGGKTVAMAADMLDSGLLIACDVRPRRLELLQATVRRSGAARTRVVHVTTAGHLPFRPRFDRVLVDAPCSGLGTIRRDPDIRWRREERDLELFARDQLTLLGRAADLVRPGGRLVYATCSSEPEENEAVVDALLAARRDFELLDLRRDGEALIGPLVDARGMFRTRPFDQGLDAFFAAALVRTR